ncbi:MAG: TatD family hydrolase [Gammaproteobacteria bacterium]|nr:TatD family hydrolase [Gammaproteobacteria bacterium]
MTANSTPYGLIDIGANLTHESFRGDLPQVLQRAREAGVRRLIVTGADEQGSEQAAQLAATRPDLFSTCGIHPHHAKDCHADTMDKLRALLAEHPIVAVGETGLDFYRDFSPRPVQEEWFVKHLQLASEQGLPVFLHERDAHAQFAAILAEHIAELSNVVVHCFTGDAAALTHYLEMGCYVGITGWICDERRGAHLLELVAEIPDDRLMLETDSPYLLPRDLKPKPRSRRNEPANLPHVLEAVAAARNQSARHVARETTRNAERFFRLAIR